MISGIIIISHTTLSIRPECICILICLYIDDSTVIGIVEMIDLDRMNEWMAALLTRWLVV